MTKRTNLKMATVAVLVVLVGGSVWADLTDGLIAHWAFDEGSGSIAYDSAGSNNGTLYGPTWTTGQIEGALGFDGGNDFISVPASPALNFSRFYTVSAWLKPTENPSHAMVWFGYHGGAPYGSNYYRSIHFRIYPNGAIRCGLYGDALNTATDMVTFGEWNHIVYSYDYDTETSAIYVNSQLIVSGNIDPYLGGLRTATIGKWDVGFQSQEHFKGLMDEFMVYDRALSAEEVAQLYNIFEPLAVNVDIKPGSCPNPVNVKSKGVLPVAILGSEEFDVSTIDPASVRLNDVEPIRSRLEDVAAPMTAPNECECTTNGPDGFADLTLKFETQAIVETLGEVNAGDILTLSLTGVLNNETPIEGVDCVVIVGRRKPLNKADINGDGVVNTIDMAIVAENWLKSSVVDE